MCMRRSVPHPGKAEEVHLHSGRDPTGCIQSQPDLGEGWQCSQARCLGRSAAQQFPVSQECLFAGPCDTLSMLHFCRCCTVAEAFPMGMCRVCQPTMRLGLSVCPVQACKAEARRRRVPLSEVVWAKLGKYQGWDHLAAQSQWLAHAAFTSAPFLVCQDTSI